MSEKPDNPSAPDAGRMDPEVKAKWLTALRSGEYEQGKDRLRKGESFCCLGVLANELGWLDKRGRCGAGGYGELSEPRAKSVGIEHVQGELASMNDEGWSFAQIADYIEANL